MKIDTICDALLDALAEARYHENTIFNYKGIIRRFKDFCDENAIDTYIPFFGKTYAEDVVSKKTGQFSMNRYHSQGRFIRLLDSYYNTSAFDFTILKRGKVQPTNENHKRIYSDYGIYLRKAYENENTIHFYEYELYYFLQYLNEIQVSDVEELTSVTVFEYIKYVKQNRQRAILCGLRRYFKYLGRDDLYMAMQGIHAYRHKRIIPTLTDDEQVSIKETMHSHTVSYRDTAIVLLGLSTGIRACDLINLKLSDIDWINETISFKQSKTGNTVCIPLTVTVGNAIANYLTQERPKADNNYLFVRQLAPFNCLTDHASCYAVVKRIFKRSGISKLIVFLECICFVIMQLQLWSKTKCR